MEPMSLQGEHTITTVFCMPDRSTLQVRIRVVENLLAVILILVTIQTEKFTILFLTLKISRVLDKRENQSLDDLFNFMDIELGALHELSQVNILHALKKLYEI